MKLLLLALMVLPTLAHADVDPNLQDQLNQMQPRWDDTPPRDDSPMPAHRTHFACTAKDATGREYQSSWSSSTLEDAKRRGLSACVGWFGRRSCHITKCVRTY